MKANNYDQILDLFKYPGSIEIVFKRGRIRERNGSNNYPLIGPAKVLTDYSPSTDTMIITIICADDIKPKIKLI